MFLSQFVGEKHEWPVVIWITLTTLVVSLSWRTLLRIPQTCVAKLRLHWLIRSSSSSEVGAVKISGLFKYPVKSLQTVEIKDSVALDARGLEGDRRLMLVTPRANATGKVTHQFLSQRQCPALATIAVTVEDSNHVTLRCGSKVETNIPLIPTVDATVCRARLWDSTVVVHDLGDRAAAFVQKIADASSTPVPITDIRLVRQMGDDLLVSDKYVPSCARTRWWGQTPSVALTDGFPILLTNQASLDELNRRLREKGEKAVVMSNFRPNIVITGAAPFEEDSWKVIRINGSVILHVAKGCPRCKQSCTNQTTGVVSREPLATLAEFRAMTCNKENVYFGQNLLVGAGSIGSSIAVGGTVEVLERGDPTWDE